MHLYPRSASRFICAIFLDSLDGWDGGVGVRSKRNGIYVYINLIYVVVQQKWTQHCKAIIFSEKLNKINLKGTKHTHTHKRHSLYSSFAKSLLGLVL